MPAKVRFAINRVRRRYLGCQSCLGPGPSTCETKEQLKLDYKLSVVDHGTGRVTVDLAIADQGRLKPLDSVDLVVPSKDGTGFVDLSLSLATRKVDGKLLASVHLKRELAERAEIQLRTSNLDGKTEGLTWYYHAIPIAEYLKNGERKKN